MLRTEQLTRPGAVEARRTDGIDPFFQRNGTGSRPDAPAALVGPAQRPRRADGVAHIYAANELPIDSGDVIGCGARIPQVPEVNGESDVVLGRVVQNVQDALEIAERCPREWFDVEADAELAPYRTDLLQVRGCLSSQIGRIHDQRLLVRTRRIQGAGQELDARAADRFGKSAHRVCLGHQFSAAGW